MTVWMRRMSTAATRWKITSLTSTLTTAGAGCRGTGVDGIGKQVMYGLYCITNFIWTINLYLSNASGYLVQEAYSLNFISDAADEIGRNIQSIAGISPSGVAADGF